MNISLSEASSYRLWKRLTKLFSVESTPAAAAAAAATTDIFSIPLYLPQQQLVISVPDQAVAIVTRKYLASNQDFVSRSGTFTWKVMVKINLCDLVVKLISSSLEDRVDELGFQRLWQMIHLENMATFFDMVIELLDENASANGYVLSSERMYLALCRLANNNGCSRVASQSQTGFLHFICYFYCGTSPGFLHKHEVVLLLQDLCRDWRIIYERIFNFCDMRNSNTERVPIGLMKKVLSTLIGDASLLLNIAKTASDAEDTIGKSDFLTFMRSEYPAFICNETRLIPLA